MSRAVLSLTAIAFSVFGGTTAAQDLNFSIEPVEACLAGAKGATGEVACIGTAAEACIGSPGGYTTVGMGFCYRDEAAYWDERLNAAFADLMTIEQNFAREAETLGAPSTGGPAALRNMQRAWIGYRDATCAYEYSTWGGGSGGGPAVAACLMQETGEQALMLERRLADRIQ